MDEKNGRLYAESGPEREVCAMTMKCPNCGAEFFDGREVCTDCQTPLVKKEEGKNGNAEFGSEGVDVEMLTTVSISTSRRSCCREYWRIMEFHRTPWMRRAANI